MTKEVAKKSSFVSDWLATKSKNNPESPIIKAVVDATLEEKLDEGKLLRKLHTLATNEQQEDKP